MELLKYIDKRHGGNQAVFLRNLTVCLTCSARKLYIHALRD